MSAASAEVLVVVGLARTPNSSSCLIIFDSRAANAALTSRNSRVRRSTSLLLLYARSALTPGPARGALVKFEASEMLILEALDSSDGDIRVGLCGIFSEMSFGSRVDSRASDGSGIVVEVNGEG